MKKFLLVLTCVLFSFGCVSNGGPSHGPLIPDMPRFDPTEAQPMGGGNFDCGVAVNVSYRDIMVTEDTGLRALWRVFVIGDKSVVFTRLVLTSEQELTDGGIWIDYDADMTPDEFYATIPEIKTAYGSVCGFVNKYLAR
jgi:hypothetical protein